MWPILTRDNNPLSQPITGSAKALNEIAIASYVDQLLDAPISIDCNEEVSDGVLGYLRNGLSANTRRAYAADLRHFENWGGAIPASEAMVANYLAAHAGKLSCATLERRLATLSKIHRMHGLVNPVSSDLVRATMIGIRRKHGVAQRQARPLMRDELLAILKTLGSGLKDRRDRALLLIGFAGAFRRSELVGIKVEDIEWRSDGLSIFLRSSKTDQLGKGRMVQVPKGSPETCPVAALENSISHACIHEGAVFRSIDRHGTLGLRRLSGNAVSLIVKKRARSIGLNECHYSGHSLSAGLATSAAAAGVPSISIRHLTGHKQEKTLARYIRNSCTLSDNPLRDLL